MKRVKRPCDECPWRADCEPGRFAEERWEALRGTSPDEDGYGPGFETCSTTGDLAPPVLFACHKTPEGEERACAGWLAVEGSAHPLVRLDVLTGTIPASALSPGEGWPDLHADFHTTMRHDLQEGQ